MRERLSVIVIVKEDGEGETLPDCQVSLLNAGAALAAALRFLAALQVRGPQQD